MSKITIPNFGELLAEHLGQVPPDAMPYALAQLEKSAARRYRGWAQQVPEHATGLMACADREDEIAHRAEALLPVSAEEKARVDALIPAAVQTYYTVFKDRSPEEQMAIQANAERQGAGAWRNLKAAHPELEDRLEAMSRLEETTADFMDSIID